jgi:hypothetical protein
MYVMDGVVRYAHAWAQTISGLVSNTLMIDYSNDATKTEIWYQGSLSQPFSASHALSQDAQ